jgi:hypothetical protein
MKIKLDFITNSSSSCYIFESDEKIRRNDLSSRYFRIGDSFKCFNSKKEIIAYTQNSKCDWVDEIRCSPKTFHNISESTFNNLIHIILEGKTAIMLYVDRNIVYGHLEDELFVEMENLGANFIMKESY